MDVIRNLSGVDVVLLVIAMLAACGLWIKRADAQAHRGVEGLHAARAATQARDKIEPAVRSQGVRVGAPVPVVVVWHEGPPAPHLDGVKSAQALTVEQWLSSNECEPPEWLGYRTIWQANKQRKSS
jgi:hypothetical protein